jgi:ATP-dependent RNA helicase DDX3X
MADQLKMSTMSLNDSQHAPQANGFERGSYIPPHLRTRAQAPEGHGGPRSVSSGPGPLAPSMHGGNSMNGNGYNNG